MTSILDSQSQTELIWVLGPPEGRDFAPPGFLEIDSITGNVWRKTTRIEYNIGWVLMGSSSISSGRLLLDTLADLPTIPPEPSIIWDVSFRDGSPSFIWDPRDQQWI